MRNVAIRHDDFVERADMLAISGHEFHDVADASKVPRVTSGRLMYDLFNKEAARTLFVHSILEPKAVYDGY